MIQQFKRLLYLHGYLLIAAAWLFTLSFIFSNYWTYSASLNGVKKSIETRLHEQETDFQEWLSDSAAVLMLYNGEAPEGYIEEAASKEYGIYLYEVNAWQEYQLKFWNNQRVAPESNRLFWGDSTRLRNLPSGQFVMVQKPLKIGGRRILAVALLQIREEYFIENDYLKKGFIGLPEAESQYKINLYDGEIAVKNIDQQRLFFLEARSNQQWPVKLDGISLALRLGGLLLLLLFIQAVAEQVSQLRGAFKGISLLAGALVFLRLLSYFLPIPFQYRLFDLFDPVIFASNAVHPSLGDLFINALLFFWIMLYARTKLENVALTFQLSTSARRVGLILLNAWLLISTNYICGIIQSLVTDSTKVSFNVTNFFSLNEYSIIGFVVLACLALGYFYMLQLLLRFQQESLLPEKENYLAYLIPAVMGLAYLTILSFGKISGIQVFSLFWLIGIIWLNNRTIFLVGGTKLNFAGTLFWLFIFSASITAVLIEENRTKELEQRKRLAEKLSLQADRSSERLLNIALTYIDNYFLSANFYQFLNPIQNAKLKDRLVNMNFSGYLNKYDTRLYTFDANEKPLFNDDSTSFNALNTILTVQGKRTSIPGLFYYETSFDNFSYISKRDVTDADGQTLGYLYFLAKPKKYKGEALSPELFRQQGDIDPEFTPYYSYAVYNNYELVNNFNEYPFPIQLSKKNLPVEDIKIVRRGSYDELWYKIASDKYVVVARKVNAVLEAITLFAYIFCSFLFLVALFRIFAWAIKTRFRWTQVRELLQINIRTQVHSTIIFISLFSFIVIGIATISFFINRYNNNNRDRLSRTMQVIVNEVKNKLNDAQVNAADLNWSDPAIKSMIDVLVEDVAEVHNAEVNVYDLNGVRKVSSRPVVYEKGILSDQMDPRAFYKLNQLRQVQVVQNEKIGRLAFLSIYAPLRNEQGNPVAYLNIPYFASEKELNQEISNFLVTIINLNAFIFLVAGVIALFITNRITRSFLLIAEKMKAVNLASINEEIEWTRQDEIGGLVKEYNKMVQKLESSAQALAKSEREGAWREMARQVAHEIKNPLTPMKLSIQYLQKAIDANSPNVKEMTARVASTLVEQIEHLSKIASDFSQFANIGNPKKEILDLHQVIQPLVGLYQGNENMNLVWEPIQEKVWIEADRTQINRLFTNLLQNAWEACKDQVDCQVTISESRKESLSTLLAQEAVDKLLPSQEESNSTGTFEDIESAENAVRNSFIVIRVQDNGEGIPVGMQSKIFTPNFTTKTSGTGLGLAMCKGIVEQSKGRIWFETSEKGTSFFVEFPTVKPNGHQH
jgi:two-component system nitrogen regulation sensor histidine kinase NtrY